MIVLLSSTSNTLTVLNAQINNDSPHSQVGDTTAEKERAAMRNSTARFKSCFFLPSVPRFARVSKLARLKVMNQYLPSPPFLPACLREKAQREYSESKEREDSKSGGLCFQSNKSFEEEEKKGKNRRDFNRQFFVFSNYQECEDIKAMIMMIY